MPLTRTFKETIVKRIKADPEFRRALLAESISEFLEGDLEVAKSMLKDYINATISFEPLAEKLNKKNSKSIQQMLGPKGNPTAKSLFEVLKVLQKNEDIQWRMVAS